MSFDIKKWLLKIDTLQLYPNDFSNVKVGLGTDDPQDTLDIGSGAIRFSLNYPSDGNPALLMYFGDYPPSNDSWQILFYNDYWGTGNDIDALVFRKNDYNHGSAVVGGFAFLGIAADDTQVHFLNMKGDSIKGTEVAINKRDADFNAVLDVNGPIRAGRSFVDNNQVDVLYAGYTTSSDGQFHTKDGFRIRLEEDFEGTGKDAVIFDKTDTGNGVDGITVFRNVSNSTSDVAMVIRGDGMVGIGRISTAAKLDVDGSVLVRGNLNVTGSKNFNIPDPRYNDEKKRLVHSTLEGPEAGVYYRGEAQLENGTCEILLPEYFEFLTSPEDRTVIVTPIFEDDKDKISMLAVSKIKDGKFIVKGLDKKNPNQKFNWVVIAKRKDIQFEVEQERL